MKPCEVCKQPQPLVFSLVLEDEGQKWTVYVCGRCYDAIATIAERLIQPKVDELQRQIDELKTKIQTPV